MIEVVQDYEREQAEKKLNEILQEAEELLEDKNTWISLEELKVSVGV